MSNNVASISAFKKNKKKRVSDAVPDDYKGTYHEDVMRLTSLLEDLCIDPKNEEPFYTSGINNFTVEGKVHPTLMFDGLMNDMSDRLPEAAVFPFALINGAASHEDRKEEFLDTMSKVSSLIITVCCEMGRRTMCASHDQDEISLFVEADDGSAVVLSIKIHMNGKEVEK
ncbi:MAG: hypothetical protein CL582_17855 [Alteromonadaceae bacterium]|nr:hypothetical protein [Alteromonadaceae bacterium]|tara:strand:- start:79126 stop:79635 length:510 start_codon:yes stop_codon:yes gene_type:complete